MSAVLKAFVAAVARSECRQSPSTVIPALAAYFPDELVDPVACDCLFERALRVPDRAEGAPWRSSPCPARSKVFADRREQRGGRARSGSLSRQRWSGASRRRGSRRFEARSARLERRSANRYVAGDRPVAPP